MRVLGWAPICSNPTPTTGTNTTTTTTSPTAAAASGRRAKFEYCDCHSSDGPPPYVVPPQSGDQPCRSDDHVRLGPSKRQGLVPCLLAGTRTAPNCPPGPYRAEHGAEKSPEKQMPTPPVAFDREHSKDMFGSLEPIQVSVAGTHAVTPKGRRPKPQKHKFHSACCTSGTGRQ